MAADQLKLSLAPIEPGSLHSISDVHSESRPAEHGSGPVLSGADDQAAGTRAGRLGTRPAYSQRDEQS